ncbi:MAG: GtrA family protein [Pseudanabaenaceae cyanobacterium]
MNHPIYVLGAGPAGLAAAYTLTKQQLSANPASPPTVCVLERENAVGGLAKSITYRGFILDYGPHRFFTKITPVLDLWQEVLGADQVTVNRLTRIYYQKKYFSYPLKAWEVLKTIGFWQSLEIVISYLQARLFPNKNPRNFAEWVTSKFGKKLFQIFFEGYTEKLWGIKCTEISAEWAAQRIKGLSLGKAIRNALFGNDGKVKSLVEQFQFPKLGSGQLYEKMAAYLREQNQQVQLNAEVVKIHHQNHQITHITWQDRITGELHQENCRALISSIPLSALIQQLEPAPPTEVVTAARSLRFRNTILVYLLIAGTDLFPDNWLYINDPTVGVGRVTNFANWSPHMLANHEQTPLCCEYWCNFEEPLWAESEEALLQRAEKELRSIGLLKDQAVIDGFVVRLPRTYPIYTGNYKEALATIQSYLSGFSNLQVVGRYGAFKYNNQDHSLLMGILAAENIDCPGKHDLWVVNSDSEYGEEAKADQATSAAKVSPIVRGNGLIRQFIKYLFTGGFATIVDALVYKTLVDITVPYKIALAIAFVFGLTTNFWLSRRYVFGIYWRNWLVQYVVFATVALNSLLANYGVIGILVDDLGWDAKDVITRLVSAACVAILSFTGHKLYSFAQSHPAQQQS